ncbi:MAG: hypothetical protein HYX48_07970 [Chlamydiales bacterium]|nr:hypothetical protein [Chlamydiales bacterium]
MYIFLLIFSLICSWSSTLHAGEPQEEYCTLQLLDPKGYQLLLDDHSIWEVNWTNSWSSYSWKVGDKIRAVTTSPGAAEFQLINLDRSSSIYAKRTRVVDERYIESIADITQGGNWIQLDSNAMWRVDKRDRNEALKWEVGDEVLLSVVYSFFSNEPDFYLKNLRTGSSAWVHFHKQAHTLDCPRIKDIFWTHIELTDGTQWTYSVYWPYMGDWGAGWEAGDRVEVFFDPNNMNQYTLFNYDSAKIMGGPLVVTPYKK